MRCQYDIILLDSGGAVLHIETIVSDSATAASVAGALFDATVAAMEVEVVSGFSGRVVFRLRA